MWFDLGLGLDLALRVAGACAKLRHIIPWNGLRLALR
jgi:hypothetical protein